VHFQVENFKAQLLSGFDVGFLPGDFDVKIADLFHESRLVTRLIVSDSPRESNAQTRDDVELAAGRRNVHEFSIHPGR
jgi:hypothetical protein